jgi:hypothetical protein
VKIIGTIGVAVEDRGSGALSGVLAGWATMDGAAASAYVGGIEDEREQRGAAFGVLQGMLVNGVDEAMGFVRNLPDSEDSARTKRVLYGDGDR